MANELDKNSPNLSQLEQESTDALLSNPEPWEKWESQLVVWSIGIAILGLVVLGYLINSFILS